MAYQAEAHQVADERRGVCPGVGRSGIPGDDGADARGGLDAVISAADVSGVDVADVSDVSDVSDVWGAVTGAGGGVATAGADPAEVSLVIGGTVEKSPGLLSIISNTPETTRAAAAMAITDPRNRVFCHSEVCCLTALTIAVLRWREAV